MSKYYFHNGQNQFGPYSISELKEKEINRNTSIWFEGLENWTTAGELIELNELFISIPPPITPIKKSVPPTNDRNQTSLGLANKNDNSIITENLKFKFKPIHYGIILILILSAIGTYTMLNNENGEINNDSSISNSSNTTTQPVNSNTQSSNSILPTNSTAQDFSKSNSTQSQSNNSNFESGKKSEPKIAVIPLMRFHKNGGHLYTTDRNEGTGNGYQYEGVIGYVPTSGGGVSVPCYRFYNQSNNDHLYSLDKYEGAKAGYLDEGVTWYIFRYKVAGSVPLYRFVLGSKHFYSTDINEGTAAGFTYEGVLGYINAYEN